jgi:hypothetical protein
MAHLNKDRSFEYHPADAIAFILTVFSTILAILPFIESTSQDNSADQIARLRALSILNNNNQPIDKRIWAYEELHDSEDINTLYNNNPKSAEANLAMALVHYNNDTNYSDYTKSMANFTDKAKAYSSALQHSDLSKRIWFTKRILGLERAPRDNSQSQWMEDAMCIQMHNSKLAPNMCTYGEFNNITEYREKLVQNGILSDFYNNDGRVHALRDGIETFVFDLNHFIIVSFIVGPIAFVAAIRFYFKRIETLKKKVK